MTTDEQTADRVIGAAGLWGGLAERDHERLLAAIAAAVVAERERCAAVADSFADHQWADPKAVAAAIRR